MESCIEFEICITLKYLEIRLMNVVELVDLFLMMKSWKEMKIEMKVECWMANTMNWNGVMLNVYILK